MENTIQFQKLCQAQTRKLILVMAILASVVMVIQSFGLPYGNVLWSLFPVGKNAAFGKSSFPSENSSLKTAQFGDVTLNESRSADLATVFQVADNETEEKHDGPQEVIEPDKVSHIDVFQNKHNESSPGEAFNTDQNVRSQHINGTGNGSTITKTREPEQGISMDHLMKPENENSSGDGHKENTSSKSDKSGNTDTDSASPSPVAPQVVPSAITVTPEGLDSKTNHITSINSTSSVVKQQTETYSNGQKPELFQDSPSNLLSTSMENKNPVAKVPKPKESPTSVTSISEMNSLLAQSRATSFVTRPQWLSVRDRELVSARKQIENAPIIWNDEELFAPIFRNLSMFKRSYELMERLVKVYVYREGERTVFHRPVLSGIYASEGWFMKHMEANKHFVVKDPNKAHLFYLPFSSRQLEETLYVPNSHSQKNLVEYLKNYLDTISMKYPYWNRTGGEDHFLAACHDWAPYETKHHMNRCIRALCNADVMEGFKIGKDVSLPETYVRNPKDPLKGAGGNPPSKRPILAFFAGNMHGYVRPILLQYWENKDPDMKIFGRLGYGSKKKSEYLNYMKSSKYCICAKGYEVNSPRVVEAIFYGCIPVILSDNFVPPFFEVLNWEAFAVFVQEKDIPKLKEILLSIPEKRFRQLQLRVLKVQKHFLWHNKPVKYDLFHMTLHSIWYNRVFQVRE